MHYLPRANLHIASCLVNFIEHEVLSGLAINAKTFWHDVAILIEQLTPENQRLLTVREHYQQQIDNWYQSTPLVECHPQAYQQFLQKIGYITPEVPTFNITTKQVDAEIATMAGPQLVVPIMNARFALNAVNARWGSLYDAVYASDVIDSQTELSNTNNYNPERGKRVVNYVKTFLDSCLPLEQGSHLQAVNYSIKQQQLLIELANGSTTQLTNKQSLKGYSGESCSPTKLLLQHNGLFIELSFDRQHAIGKHDPAGLVDVMLESALTTIMDCEDSVAAVDANDKVLAYRNWLQLNQGKLTAKVQKQGKQFIRTMQTARNYLNLAGEPINIKARSLLFIRNVGHLMTTNAVLDQSKNPVFEGIVDAIFTSLIALYDRQKQPEISNSAYGSIYIVKPKMHGPDEVKFANQLFSRVEQILKLPENTIKMGIMDEERRTSLNLQACIYEARARVVFINTGFLDRTGDEIHTCMAAGAVLPKHEIKNTAWLNAYELNNVAVGLACGFAGKAQIGKGMWPIPDHMADMMASKINHPLAGANTAWVPSPTAATLHAMHYHQVNVMAQQTKLLSNPSPTSAYIIDMLKPPLATDTNWSTSTIAQELDNNVQGILGYVVRWIDQGIGCSKVPDINDVGLMEDRATLRISSQHIANWLTHGVCTEAQILSSFDKMMQVVDKQNQYDSHYQPLCAAPTENIALLAAKALVFQGAEQANGYTEPLLHHFRQLKKQQVCN